MDKSLLGALAMRFFEQDLAPSTNHTYETVKRKYLSFCTSLDSLISVHINSPLPIMQGSASLFATYLAQEGLHPNTISCYLSAIRHLQIAVGQGAVSRTDWPFLQYVIKGINRANSKNPNYDRNNDVTPRSILLPVCIRF